MADAHKPRPGHGDLAGGIKWNHHDLRNVLERASARETAARTAAGALARQFLEAFGIRFASHVVQIGSVRLPDDFDRSDLARVISVSEESEVRCIDSDTGAKMIEAIKETKGDKDSLGGVAELIVAGVPAGLGSCSQWYERLDSRLAAALMGIQSVKGVEIGLGFAAASKPGSEVHDEIFYDPYAEAAKKKFHRTTNHAGGIEAGITNGENIVARVAAKPISTLNRPLRTVDVVTKKAVEAMVERTDHCVVPAVAVICEAAAAMVLADAFVSKFGGDNMAEIERHYRTYLDMEY
jgi:chorismate synthase